MKKLLIATIVTVMSLSLVACNDKKHDTGTANQDTAVIQEETKDQDITTEEGKIYKIGEEAELNNTSIIVNSATKTCANEWGKAKEGYEFIILNITLKNNNPSMILTYNPLTNFSIQDKTGKLSCVTPTLPIDRNTMLSNGQLAVGEEISGEIAFEQPIGTDLTFRYQTAITDDKEVLIKLDNFTIEETSDITESNINIDSNNQVYLTEYNNALETAKDYDELFHMSKQELYDQLIYEQFPEDAAQYAIDNININWNKNALLTAKYYYEEQHMSRAELYDQLIYEQFTPEEAQYAMDNIN